MNNRLSFTLTPGQVCQLTPEYTLAYEAATRLAKILWGPTGTVQFTDHGVCVGLTDSQGEFVCKGAGLDYIKAFQDADRLKVFFSKF